MSDAFKAAIGRTVLRYESSGDEVDLVLDDAKTLRLSLDGDCCSSSYFTDPEQFLDLVDCRIKSIEERSGQSDNNLPPPEGSDVLEWHNDSNGYYGGSLHARIVERS